MNAMSCATESCRFFHSSSSLTTTMSTPAVGRSNSRDLIIIGTPLEYRTFPPQHVPPDTCFPGNYRHGHP